MNANYAAVLDFWFGPELEDPAVLRTASKHWFEKNEKFDTEIRDRFGDLPEAAANGDLSNWRTEDEGLLALIIVLDQFPRNLFRNHAKSFSYDNLALEHAISALDRGLQERLHPLQSVFIFMPLEHSEDLQMQQRCVAGLQRLQERTPAIWQDKVAGFLRFAIAHQEVIERFGRFPHRNAILGRSSSEAEREFLASGRGAF